jgi:hypothetical protein
MIQEHIIKAAREAFAHNPTAQVLHVTSDGVAFLEHKKNAAELYSTNMKVSVHTITRHEATSGILAADKKAAEAQSAELQSAIKQLNDERTAHGETKKEMETLALGYDELLDKHEEMKTVQEILIEERDALRKQLEEATKDKGDEKPNKKK